MRVIGATLVAAFMLTAAPAGAQVVDLSTIKCKDFLDSGQQSISYIMLWLDGYFSDQEAPPVINFDKMKGKGEKLGAFCSANPTEGLIKAAEDIFGE